MQDINRGTGGRGREEEIHENSLYFVQLFCKPKTILKLKSIFKNSSYPKYKNKTITVHGSAIRYEIISESLFKGI